MRDTGGTHPFKVLLIDVLMAAILLLLLTAAGWMVWVFYVRGPVQLEPQGFLSRTEPSESLRPQDVDRYTLRHFHNLDETSVAGIPYRSPCLACHGDYPHGKSVKVRAFFNAHSWFIDCDVCHKRPPDNLNVDYRWISNVSESELSALEGAAGNYGGRIAPVRIKDGLATRISNPAAEAFIKNYLRAKSGMDETQKTAAERRIHRLLTDEPLFCDNCHVRNGRLNFEKLLYSAHDSTHLQSIDVAAMVTTYSEFHLPSLFDYGNPLD